MRQLLYVEKILFTDAVEFSDEGEIITAHFYVFYPILSHLIFFTKNLGAISKLTGASTLDAELIMIDLM